MTLPYERRWAITNARAFLERLCDPWQTPHVPPAIRQEAAERLKHFPNEFDMLDVLGAFGPPTSDIEGQQKSCTSLENNSPET